jgi:hypothetical protein
MKVEVLALVSTDSTGDSCSIWYIGKKGDAVVNKIMIYKQQKYREL